MQHGVTRRGTWLLLLLTAAGCSRVGTQTTDSPATEFPVPPEIRNATDAAKRGLLWLEHSQNQDGSWGSKADERHASTGMALLAFFYHDEMPMGSKKFGVSVKKGLEFLVAEMPATNKPAGEELQAIGHAIAVQALCEGYGMTINPNLKDASERGLAVILRGQRATGLWDGSYRTAEGEDSIEASVWQVLAVKSGLMAGVETNGLREALSKALDAMERVLAAKPDDGTKVAALLCLQMGGRSMKPVCREAFAGLATMTADWDAPSFRDPIFRWYLASQVFYWEGGPRWTQWWRPFIPMLCEHQVVKTNGRALNCES